MAKILFLAHRVPFPPDKGDKIRAFNILNHLSARHDIWLGAGADDPADLKHLPMAKAQFSDACFAPLNASRRAWNMFIATATGAPLSIARFRHPQMERWIAKVLREVRPDIVFIYSSAMAQYVVGRLAPGTRLIVDFVDADAEKWRAYARRSGPLLNWIYAAEFRRLIRFDGRLLDEADAGLLVSETERELFAGFLPASAPKLQVMSNGVDANFFQPQATPSDGRSTVFCGRMDYQPNIEGARWFAHEVLPLLRQRCPHAIFRVVGAKPTAQVLALADLAGVEVTGSVEDVRPYLAQAEAVVAPLHIARGIQNKVLEGMAVGRPMVATPQALDGIDAMPGRDILVAAVADAFAAAVADVLEGNAPPDLGERARAYVVAHHEWSAKLATLDRLIAGITRQASGETAT